MKKINSIDYGGKVIGAGITIGVGIPVVLRFVNIVVKSSVLEVLMWITFGAGIMILAAFFIYLQIELHQDKKIDRYYSLHRNIKIPLGNGRFECAACGNQRVAAGDTACTVCGVTFSEDMDKSVQQIID